MMINDKTNNNRTDIPIPTPLYFWTFFAITITINTIAVNIEYEYLLQYIKEAYVLMIAVVMLTTMQLLTLTSFVTTKKETIIHMIAGVGMILVVLIGKHTLPHQYTAMLIAIGCYAVSITLGHIIHRVHAYWRHQLRSRTHD